MFLDTRYHHYYDLYGKDRICMNISISGCQVQEASTEAMMVRVFIIVITVILNMIFIVILIIITITPTR